MNDFKMFSQYKIHIMFSYHNNSVWRVTKLILVMISYCK